MTTQNPDSAPLYGLVLAGGKSRRMGRDKALLNYHGKPQVVWLFDLLEPFCHSTYVSVAPDQIDEPHRATKPQIVDHTENLGPSGGLLTAHEKFPQAAWMVVACDLPFIESETLSYLIEQRDSNLAATAFRSTHDGLPEPLCSIWEPAGLTALSEQLGNGKTCPRKRLINSEIKLLEQENPRWLDNMNSPSDLTAHHLDA